VSDRFVDSMFAYQGAGREVSNRFLQMVTQYSVGELMPDLTVVCDVDVDTANARIEGRSLEGGGLRTRYEQTDRELRQRIREGFLDHASVVPERCVVVDTTDRQDQVAARIWSVIAERLDVDDGEG